MPLPLPPHHTAHITMLRTPGSTTRYTMTCTHGCRQHAASSKQQAHPPAPAAQGWGWAWAGSGPRPGHLRQAAAPGASRSEGRTSAREWNMQPGGRLMLKAGTTHPARPLPPHNRRAATAMLGRTWATHQGKRGWPSSHYAIAGGSPPPMCHACGLAGRKPCQFHPRPPAAVLFALCCCRRLAGPVKSWRCL